MKIIEIDQGTDEWLNLRKGKITGSKLKDIVVIRGNSEKDGFYKLLADKLAIDEAYEDPMERGHRLEDDALQMFGDVTGKKVAKSGFWISDENENMACSPDGIVVSGKTITEAIEIKCLSAGKHLEAWFTKEIPDEYKYQVLQYFIVNEKLKTLYFCFYDPRINAKPFFYLTVDRKDKEDDIKYFSDYQKQKLIKINQLLSELAF